MAFGKALMKNITLIHLNLSNLLFKTIADNQAGDPGLVAISSAFTRNSIITELLIGNI